MVFRLFYFGRGNIGRGTARLYAHQGEDPSRTPNLKYLVAIDSGFSLPRGSSKSGKFLQSHVRQGFSLISPAFARGKSPLASL
jgi:hypothetical protein